jgi:hypothetical protein
MPPRAVSRSRLIPGAGANGNASHLSTDAVKSPAVPPLDLLTGLNQGHPRDPRVLD